MGEVDTLGEAWTTQNLHTVALPIQCNGGQWCSVGGGRGTVAPGAKFSERQNLPSSAPLLHAHPSNLSNQLHEEQGLSSRMQCMGRVV